MKRRVFHLILVALIGVFALNGVVSGADDKVERRDRKTNKLVIVSGKIADEKIDGIRIRTGGGKDELIPGTEIVRVYYSDVPSAANVLSSNLFINEEKEKDLTKTIREYEDLLDKSKGGPNRATRYFKYRIAALQASIADTEAKKEGAVKMLQSFVQSESNCWEYPIAARMLGQLYMAKGDYDSALRTIEPLAKGNGIPADIKAEADNMLIDVMFQANKLDVVKGKIESALNSPTASATQKARYGVYLVGIEGRAPNANIDDVVKKLDDIIAKPTSDNSIKALAFNVMGDCYQARKRTRDAMYSYLWVDVVYPHDRSEHLKALNKLQRIFEDEKDNDKAQIVREKIMRLK